MRMILVMKEIDNMKSIILSNSKSLTKPYDNTIQDVLRKETEKKQQKHDCLIKERKKGTINKEPYTSNFLRAFASEKNESWLRQT